MPPADEPLDLDSLIGAWRAAFEAASAALRAARHDLPAHELGVRLQHLHDERAATARVLSGFARDRHARSFLVRLVASPREARRLLGLPVDVAACVFNVDGVLVASAAIHAEAWKEAFDEFVSARSERTGGEFAYFSRRTDYPTLIHGKSRVDAVREFLASRGISLPEGRPDDPPGEDTVLGLANRKNRALLRLLARHDVSTYAGARLYLRLAQDAGLHCAVVSGSTNTETLLESARLTELIEDCVDGRTMLAEGLHRKPAPDMLLAACRHLGVEPGHTAVFETTRDGVTAGRAGGFGLVVAVDQYGTAQALRSRGADLVVADLGEILERELAAPGNETSRALRPAGTGADPSVRT
jgi:beta-phosphoglucomutase-like phosphatase (HAD superfamily)